MSERMSDTDGAKMRRAVNAVDMACVTLDEASQALVSIPELDAEYHALGETQLDLYQLRAVLVRKGFCR